jgi:formylglycine-generating enzyme required for sulfatase activity
MGSPEEEEGSNWWERPQHKVKVSPFLMGRYLVTQAQWRAVASLPKVEGDLNPDPSYYKGASLPVECVSWYEAVEFCRRLSLVTGKEYRLPSEAEWEYACRAGTETPYHFGQKISPALANYIKTARGQTTPVGRFQVANAFGLYDMHGNVWEWCADHWHESYADKPENLKQNGNIAWIDDNITNQLSMLLRGGSWSAYPHFCRSAGRGSLVPDGSVSAFGLRVVASSRT